MSLTVANSANGGALLKQPDIDGSLSPDSYRDGEGEMRPLSAFVNRVRLPRPATKLLRIMKLLSIFLFTAGLHVSAAGHSQQVTLSEKNAPLQTIFQKINAQTGYLFFYNETWISQTKAVSIDVKDASLQQALDMCFRDQPITYEIVEKTVVVKEKTTAVAPSPLEHPKDGSGTRGDEAAPPAVLIDITGRITNAQGEPLAGASVIIKRTGKGDIANANGQFKLKNVNNDDIIVISFTGYKQQSIKVGDRTNLTLVLDVAVDDLDRVVIQGYGKTTQRLATGNIAKVTSEEIERQPVMNPLLALQGKVPGLDVTQTNGFASAPVKVELRGRNVIGVDPNHTFPADPLYIIDGVPLTILEIGGASSYSAGSTGFLQSPAIFRGPAGGQSPFFNINPADIESIEVLKDADATAIYGSRGANGVILITTKKGKAGKTSFDLHIQQGISKVTRFWDMMNTQQYLQMRHEALQNDGISPTIADGEYDLLLWDTTRYTDWQRTLFGGTGKSTDIQAAISGGNAQTSFRIGTGYNRTTNIMTVNGADQRASLSFNVMNHSKDQRFSISLSGTYSVTKSDLTNVPSEALILPPNAPPIYDSAGNLNYKGFGGLNGSIRNLYPFASLKQPYVSKTNFLKSNLVVGFQPLKGLRLSTSAGYNVAQANQQQLMLIASYDPLSNPVGTANWAYNNNKNWIIEPQVSYERLIAKGQFSILVGGTFQENSTDGVSTAGTGYTSDDLIGTVSNAPVKAADERSGIYRYAALFSRLSFNWQNRYIINLNGRRDGSSRFGEGKQYGNFGSIGTAWIFSEETFFKTHMSFLSFGKIRGSYGTTGTDAVGDYKYLTRWSSNNSQPYGGATVLVPTQHANPNYQWQVNKKLEGAIDLGFLKDNITFSIAYYRDRCGNQLVQFPTPLMSGFSSVTANSPAEVQNDGWEFTLMAKVINSKNFKWSINFNTSINHNKLLAYPNLQQSPFASSLIVGQPLNIAQLFHYTGIDAQTGEYLVEDKDHDGQINYNPGKDNSDTYVYNLSPRFFGGLGMNFSYKALQLNLFFNIKKQIGRNALIPQGRDPGFLGNQPAEILGKEWRKPGDLATYARFTTMSLNSDYYYSTSDGLYTDASFIRLSNFALSYSLPIAYIKKVGMQGCNAFIHANNLFVFTKYKGIDPETQSFGSLPPSKTIVVGLNFNF
ncbi:MAG: SusC/RagA family TonB-linked outer membrane protein [Chitinophagaceae bacterium]